MEKGDNEIIPHAFFCAVAHTEREHILQILKEYNIGTYIIGYETTMGAHKETNGEHIHFYVEMSRKDYHKYAKRIFKDKYKLRGQARGGKPRQYGKVKVIESIEKMKIYTVKEGKVDTNLTEKELKELMEKSYEKDETLGLKDAILEWLDKTVKEKPLVAWGEETLDEYVLDCHNCCRNYKTLEKNIVMYCLSQGIMPCSATMIKTIIKAFLFRENIEINVKAKLFLALDESKNPWNFYG